MIGRTLSHYQIVERIAAGGMGVVYRARDLRLKRDVALKVLPTEVLTDEKSQKRFRREALTLSRLSHPNIGTIFDFDSQEGVDFLVMEYVAGPWLEDRLRGGPLPEVEALRIGVQIAEALQAAHHEGVIHRDLKPANVGLTPDGHVKVLDFGLARLLAPVSEDSSTRSGEETKGVAGTMPYMAPEQLLGHDLDGRVDIYAFGVILYRMAVGRLPFEEKNSTALANRILNAEPTAPIQVNPRVSPRLQEVILRCLEKDPAYRYQTAEDLKSDLNRCRKELESGVASTRTKQVRRGAPSRAWVPIALAAAAVAIVLLVVLLLRGKSVLPPTPRYQQMTFLGSAADPGLSPDGTAFAYVDQSQMHRDRVMIRDIRQGQALEVFASSYCKDLRWSPDGSSILCLAERDSIYQTVAIPRLGGSPRVYPVGGVAHAWSPDGSRFVTLSRDGAHVTLTDARTGSSVSFAPGGEFAQSDDVDWSPRDSLLVALTGSSSGASTLWLLRPSGRALRKIFDEQYVIQSPRWTRTGDGIYFLKSAGSVMDLCKLPVNPETGKARTPVVLLAGIEAGSSLSFSADRTRMIYAREVIQSNLWLFERAGGAGPVRSTRITTGTGFDTSPSISPDGSSIVFVRGTRAPANVIRIPIRGGEEQQLTFMSSATAFPVWSPNGDEVAFEADEGGPWRIWRVGARGGQSRVFDRSRPADPVNILAWAPGRSLVYQTPDRRSLAALDPSSGIERTLASEGAARYAMTPQWSPDGERLAFLRWWDSDRADVCLLSLRDSTILSRHGVPLFLSRWSGDGRFVFAWDHQDDRESIIAIPVDGGKVRTLMNIPTMGDLRNPVVTPDGRRAVASVVTHQRDAWLVENFERHR